MLFPQKLQIPMNSELEYDQLLDDSFLGEDFDRFAADLLQGGEGASAPFERFSHEAQEAQPDEAAADEVPARHGDSIREWRCLDAAHSTGCQDCVRPPEQGDEGRWELIGDPVRDVMSPARATPFPKGQVLYHFLRHLFLFSVQGKRNGESYAYTSRLLASHRKLFLRLEVGGRADSIRSSFLRTDSGERKLRALILRTAEWQDSAACRRAGGSARTCRNLSLLRSDLSFLLLGRGIFQTDTVPVSGGSIPAIISPSLFRALADGLEAAAAETGTSAFAASHRSPLLTDLAEVLRIHRVTELKKGHMLEVRRIQVVPP